MTGTNIARKDVETWEELLDDLTDRLFDQLLLRNAEPQGSEKWERLHAEAKKTQAAIDNHITQLQRAVKRALEQ